MWCSIGVIYGGALLKKADLRYFLAWPLLVFFLQAGRRGTITWGFTQKAGEVYIYMSGVWFDRYFHMYVCFFVAANVIAYLYMCFLCLRCCVTSAIFVLQIT